MSPSRDQHPSKGLSKDVPVRTLENSRIILPKNFSQEKILSLLVNPDTGDLCYYIEPRAEGFLFGENQQHKYEVSMEKMGDTGGGVEFSLSYESLDRYNKCVGLSGNRLQRYLKKCGNFDRCWIKVEEPAYYGMESEELHFHVKGWAKNGQGVSTSFLLNPDKKIVTLGEAIALKNDSEASLQNLRDLDQAAQQGFSVGMRRFILGFGEHAGAHTSKIMAAYSVGPYINAYESTPYPKDYLMLQQGLPQKTVWRYPKLVENTEASRLDLIHARNILLKSKDSKSLRKFVLFKKPLVMFRGEKMPFSKACLLMGPSWSGYCDLRDLETYTWARIRAKDFQGAILLPLAA